MESFLNGKVQLHRGDCREVIKTLPDCSVDSVVTDPPYALTTEPPTWRVKLGAPRTAEDKKARRGFMGKKWDTGEVAFDPEFWAEVWRVLKPGAHLIAMGGTRTYHHLAMAIEQAGFEIRDQIAWTYGSGFPKSHAVGKGIDKHLGKERTIKTGTKPGHENFVGRDNHPLNGGWDRPWASDAEAVDRYHSTFAPASDESAQWEGWGTALKPAWEPIVLARKPLSESSIAANVLKHGTGAINIDGCRVKTGDSLNGGAYSASRTSRAMTPHGKGQRSTVVTANYEQPEGRWPANLIHDGSEEVVERFPASSGQQGDLRGHDRDRQSPNGVFGKMPPAADHAARGDSGSAARFFYTAKADADDRLGSKHPTVKPLDLMQYLVRLITPKGGTVLDPFAGTGTTGEAAWREGMRAVLIEREPEYQADIERRMELALAGPDTRRIASIKQLPVTDLPMFAPGEESR